MKKLFLDVHLRFHIIITIIIVVVIIKQTIFVTRLFYSPDSDRANHNVNFHNVQQASTPCLLLNFWLQPSLETHLWSELNCHALPSNTKCLVQSLHQ
jgi:hypothetical protein